jgi:hypothetical protein
MVALGDFGCAERERMVAVALEHGWIQHAGTWEAKNGCTKPVVVLAAAGSTKPKGAFGTFVKKHWDWWINSDVRQIVHIRRVQKAAGLPPFVMFPMPLDVLCALVSGELAEDLRTHVARDEYTVLCMNADRPVLVAGCSLKTEATT